MIIPPARWSKFKQELLTILYISFFQIWWNFNFPIFKNLSGRWSFILPSFLSIILTVLYSYIFACADNNGASAFRWKSAEDASILLAIIRNMPIISVLLASQVGFLCMRLFNWYDMSDLQYVILYVHYIIFMILLFRAANRSPTNRQVSV